MIKTSKPRSLFEDYEGFVKKFERKKTTDDCYTPPLIYDAVLAYVDKYIKPLDGHNVVRPFYPGGDFENYPYQEGDIVIDNPPFSIISAIVAWYVRQGIPFFLFAPSLSLFCITKNHKGVTGMVADAKITYENGAIVNTSFVTNMMAEDYAFYLDPRLTEIVMDADKETWQRRKGATPKKLTWPTEVVSAALLHKVVRHLSAPWGVKRESCSFIRKLDCGKEIFGGGYLLSERAAAERAAAERAAAERAAAERLDLSERERAIVKLMK